MNCQANTASPLLLVKPMLQQCCTMFEHLWFWYGAASSCSQVLLLVCPRMPPHMVQAEAAAKRSGIDAERVHRRPSNLQCRRI